MSVNPRVLYVWQAGFPWDVRVEKICVSLAKRGWGVEILARRRPGEPKTTNHQGVKIYRVGPGSFTSLSLPVPGNWVWDFAIRKRIREFRPDIIIVRDIPLALSVAHEARRAGIPWVIDMAEHYPEAMRTWKKYQSHALSRLLINTLRLPDRIEKRSVMLADGVFPVCDEQRDRLVSQYGCDPAKIVSVTNAPEKSRFANFKVQGKPVGKRFGYHGVVIQDRDLLTVVRGFDLAADQDPEISLVIAGSGESLKDVESVVKGLRHRERIKLLGAFKPEQVDQLYSEVDFGVVSWAVNEFTNNTIANKFFDYAACGKPILYTATRPMLRAMTKMRCGRPFDGGQPESVARAMLQLVSDDYGTMVRNGRAAIDTEFNWENEMDRMLGFLNKLL